MRTLVVSIQSACSPSFGVGLFCNQAQLTRYHCPFDTKNFHSLNIWVQLNIVGLTQIISTHLITIEHFKCSWTFWVQLNIVHSTLNIKLQLNIIIVTCYLRHICFRLKEFWPICQSITSRSDSQSNEIWNYLSPATAFWMWVWYPFKWGSNAVQNGNEILTRLKMVGLLSTPGANYLDLLLRQTQPWLSIGLVCNQQQLKSFKSSEAPIQDMILARPKKLSFQARFLCLPLITRCWLFHFLFFPSLNNFIIVDQICTCQALLLTY